MSKSDGSVIIDTSLDTGDLEKDVKGLEKQFDGVADGAKALQDALLDIATASKATAAHLDEIEKELKGVEKQSEETGEEAEGMFGKMFSASALADVAVDALQEVGEALKQFVLDSIGAAADIRAENAQFAETFKDLKDEATGALQAISDETGITASRMQTNYSKVFAFTKSIGADSAQAMDIANRAMLAAADSAAYYDKSVEEATETLQSFLKGNYENDAALGIAATETTRNAKANELYAKSFNDLSEAQKVDVLLSMVEAGNEASGALGQAAREADSWTNVTGEASEAMRQLQAVIGDPVLEALIPVIKGITDAVYEMIEVTRADTMQENMDGIVETWKAAEKQFTQTEKKVRANDTVARSYVKRLRELEEAGLDSAEAQAQYTATVDALNELMPDLNLQIDEHTGLVNLDSDAILASVDAMKKKAMFVAYEEKYTAALRTQADAAIVAADAEAELARLQTQRTGIEAQLNGTAADYRKRLAEAEAQLRINLSTTASGVGITQDMIYAAAGMTEEEIELFEALLDVDREQAKLNGVMDEANGTVSEQESVLDELSDAMGEYADSAGDAADATGDLTSSAKSTTKALSETAKKYQEARDAARVSIDSQIGYFDKLSDKSDLTADEIIANWNNQKKAFDNYASNLKKAAAMGLDGALVQQLSDESNESMLILDQLVNHTDMSVDEINESFRGLNDSRDTASEAVGAVRSEILDGLDDIADDAGKLGAKVGTALAKKILGKKGAIVDAFIALANAGLDAFEGRMSGKKIQASSSGKNFQVSLTDAGTSYALNAVSEVPYLATGAVIPPNAPFFAVLGDQSHGRNLEAPEGLIRQIVHDEMNDMAGGMMAGFEATVRELRLTREAIYEKEIGDDAIWNANRRYARKMGAMTGG